MIDVDGVHAALALSGFALGLASRSLIGAMLSASRSIARVTAGDEAGPGFVLFKSGPALAPCRRDAGSAPLPRSAAPASARIQIDATATAQGVRDDWVESPAAAAADERPVLKVVPTPRAPLAEVALKPATEHAAALLAFLQGPDGVTGEIPAADIEGAYTDLCIDLCWHPRPWNTVAKALREALGDERKTYAWRDGHRLRVYRIPAKADQQKMKQVARAA